VVSCFKGITGSDEIDVGVGPKIGEFYHSRPDNVPWRRILS